MTFCPKCGREMKKWNGGWFICQSCGVAGQVEGLEWLRQILTFTRQVLDLPRPDMGEET